MGCKVYKEPGSAEKGTAREILAYKVIQRWVKLKERRKTVTTFA
jgi:hypothetical protein